MKEEKKAEPLPNNQEAPIECYVKVTDNEMAEIDFDTRTAEAKGWFPSKHGWLKKLTLYSSPAVGGMKWRSAADKPSEGWEGIVKWSDAAEFSCFNNGQFCEGNIYAEGFPFVNQNLEWLDECASPDVKDDWKERFAEAFCIRNSLGLEYTDKVINWIESNLLK